MTLQENIINSSQFQKIAHQQYTTSKWPTMKDEEWRRSDPSSMPTTLLEQYNDNKDNGDSIQENIMTTIMSHPEKEVFHIQELSSIKSQDALSLMENSLIHAKDKFDIWRLMKLQSGIVVSIPDGVKINSSLNFVLFGNNTDTVYAPVFIFVLGKHSSIKTSLIIKGDGVFLPAFISSIDSYAEYHFCEFQQSSLDSITITSHFTIAKDNTNVQKTSVQLGAMIANSRSDVRIEGSRANININGCYFANQDQLIDTRTYQNHIAQNSYSRVIYNGVAVNESHTVYRGIINVDHHAEETDAYLTNKNLLLSEEARMDSIPCLNINTNEVRCSHGSTTGSLDPNHIFYLQSRGMSEQEAQNLLVESFMESVLDSHFPILNEDILLSLREKINYIED